MRNGARVHLMDDTRSSLGSILDEYDKGIVEAEKTAKELKAKEDAFQVEFHRIRKDVIRPIMQKLGDELKKRNHGYEIQDEEEGRDEQGRRTSALGIVMKVYPKDIDGNEFLRPYAQTPNVGFHTTFGRKVFVSKSNVSPRRGGSGGSFGEFDLSQLTPEIVESKVIEGLKHIFSR